MRAWAAVAALFGLITGSVMIAVLDQGDLEPLARVWSTRTNAIAPPKPVFLVEHIFIFGRAPNQAQGYSTPPYSSSSILNKFVQTWHFDEFTGLRRFWGDEKFLPWFSVVPHGAFVSVAPIDPYSHPLCGSVSSICPHWLDRKISNIEFELGANLQSHWPLYLFCKFVNCGGQFTIKCCRYDVGTLGQSMLFVRFDNSSTHPIDLEPQNSEFQNTNKAKNYSEGCDPPIVRRLLLFIGGVLVGFLSLLFGIFKLYERRIILGSVGLLCGLGLSSGGMCLWLLMPIATTWCWPL